MTTSGSAAFNPAALDIMNMALRKVGAISEDEAASDAMYVATFFQMNGMIKEWMAIGIHVWTEEEAILFYQPGQVRYLLGGTTTDNCADYASTTFAQIATPAAAAASSITLASPILQGPGVTANQFIGIVLDAGNIFWTTVNGAPAGSVVNLAAPLPSSAGAQNFVFTFTSQIIRPLKVPKGRLFYYQGFRETPQLVLSRQEYMDLPNKTDPGTPTQFFYTPKLVSGEYYAWPAPQFAQYAGRFTWYRPLFDMLQSADTADFPQEWVNTIGWNLAKEIGPEYDMPPARWQMITQQATIKLDMVAAFDRESEPIRFGMSYDEDG